MHYPLIDPHVLANLRLVHGAYNSSVIALVLYHAWLGIRIRRQRLAGKPLPFPLIKKHRKLGPIIVVLGVAGFFIGLTLVLVHTGRLMEYPAHLFTGLAIVVLLLATFFISRRIKGQNSPFRTPHFIIGILILCLYLVEALLGLGVLL